MMRACGHLGSLKSACAGALAIYRGQALAGACGWRLEGRHLYQLLIFIRKREFAAQRRRRLGRR
eukprot:COSAG02_NODE_259_length_26776_cov_1723.750084_18_plen_64_part_00